MWVQKLAGAKTFVFLINRGGKASMEANRIYLGDCVALMEQLPDNVADLIFADPPYNLQLNGELYRPDQTRVDAVNDDWDRFESMDAYDNFTGSWLRQCKRILKPSGSIWVIGSYHNIFRVGKILQDMDFWILNDIIWLKPNPMPNFRGTRFNNAHETLIWAARSRESKYTFHYHSMKVMNDDLQMRSDWLIPVCHGDERIKAEGQKAHSAQKPEELLFRIIMSTSNPGDLILDPFAGTGTSAAVAKRLGRSFIAIEREEKYVRIATERVERTEPLEKHLLVYRTERRRARVAFGTLVAKDIIKTGEQLCSADGNVRAEVQADSSLLFKGKCGSIHKICSLVTGRNSSNGWTFWYVNRGDGLISIDDLREQYLIDNQLTGYIL